ncbi:DUF3017 domain-containing protein [Schaalia vaccimaxillae]|uniref:DUF3017 domain-containing protein n=1 Tax=Schaalia vaccimaxillae TaxID=183916 RepID=UPI0003B50D6F|nr:DUF3017 domain-containing protein [Schaalia vaccimaxillae]
MEQSTVKRLVVWGEKASMLVVLAGVASVVLLLLLDHPHRAVLSVVVMLIAMAILRLVIPGRPWFACRNRWIDSAVMAAVALAMWYLSPFTATIGLG